jgi:hypothetical protein
MSLDQSPPTMDGFAWTKQSVSLNIPIVPGGNLWCVRDTIGQLLGWPPGSENWYAFVKAPSSTDFYRLIDHLGLSWFDCHEPQLANHLMHPGILVYFLNVPGMPPDRPMAHTVFEPDLQNCNGIPYNYASYSPELFGVIVDMRQSPHGGGREGSSWLNDLTRDTIRAVRGSGIHQQW